METTSNTAAIYVRRSAADERDTDDSDNRSHARFQIEAGSFDCCQLRWALGVDL
jgi:hypothetical protein